MNQPLIDITFDARTDSKGKDPDAYSLTIKNYHKLLWSKTLPTGQAFTLEFSDTKGYLKHTSDLGDFHLASDSIIHTYLKWKRMAHIIDQLPKEELEAFFSEAYTIGGFILFPGNKIGKFNTINQERGTNRKINDRIDLTLECIRLFYKRQESPLYETLCRYKDFFELFKDFKGYCEFFLLQDLVSEDFTQIKFFLPFEGFVSNPLPKTVLEYESYKKSTLDFLRMRNQRILQYANMIISR